MNVTVIKEIYNVTVSPGQTAITVSSVPVDVTATPQTRSITHLNTPVQTQDTRVLVGEGV